MTTRFMRVPFLASSFSAALAVIAASLFGLGIALALPASAATGSLVDIVNANAPTKIAGGNFDAVQVTAPAACDPKSTRHLAHIIGVTPARAGDAAAARKWVGDNLYGTASAGLPGPLTVRSNGSWQQLADAYGQKLVAGTYRIELRCQDSLAQTIYQRWTGDVTFTSPTSWRGYIAKGVAASAVSGTPSPSPSVSASAPANPSSATPDGSSPTSRVSSSAASSPPGVGAAAGSASPTAAVAAGSAEAQSAPSSDPSLRKDLVIGVLLVLAAAGLMLRLWQRQGSSQNSGEQS